MLKPVTKLFTDHPASVDETYGEHFAFASRTGLTLIGAGLAALVHGLLPFLFERTASRTVLRLAERCGPRSATSVRNTELRRLDEKAAAAR